MWVLVNPRALLSMTSELTMPSTLNTPNVHDLPVVLHNTLLQPAIGTYCPFLPTSTTCAPALFVTLPVPLCRVAAVAT